MRIESDFGSFDCFEPSAPAAPYAVLHLRDRLDASPADNPSLTSALEERSLRVCSPAIESCWWVNLECTRFAHAVAPFAWLRSAAVEQVTQMWGVAARQIGLLGTGIGGHGALHLAYRHPREFPVVAAIAPAVDIHSHYDRDAILQDVFPNAEAARQETATLHIHPLNWPPHQWFACDPLDPDWYEGCERLASKLSSIGIFFESDLTTSAGGRRDDYERMMLPKAVEFVANGLQKVSAAS